MKILITGATGQLGLSLFDYFCEIGMEVFGTTTSYEKTHTHMLPWHFNKANEDKALQELTPDWIIHCAWPMNNLYTEEATEGSLRLFKAMHSVGTKILFISSLNAHDQNPSRYAQEKLKVESLAKERGIPLTILRPPLIVSEKNFSGILYKLQQIAKKVPILPIIFPSRMFYYIHVHDLSVAIQMLLQNEDLYDPSALTICHPEPLSFLALMKKICGKHHLLLPIPNIITHGLLFIIEKIGPYFKIQKSNLEGLIYLNEHPERNKQFDNLIEWTSFSPESR